METYKLLILTDHKNHSSENSLYALARAMHAHPRSACVHVATRNLPENLDFFSGKTKQITATTVDENFQFNEQGSAFFTNQKSVSADDYDLIWLRMPPPLSESFLYFLEKKLPKPLIINSPKGILEAGSKEFLLNFKELCPPMKMCRSVEDIIQFKGQFPIVLKPLREYGGKGIVRIDGEKVWQGKTETDFDTFIQQIQSEKIEYLGVKFLKNVSKGDKRIVVVNGQILGASLRLPPQDSWLCNAAMGGSSNVTNVNYDEINIVQAIDKTLSKMGVAMYGVDTLVDDEGKRILSEINTTSIGGLPQIEAMTGKPVVEKAANLIWDYFLQYKFK